MKKLLFLCLSLSMFLFFLIMLRCSRKYFTKLKLFFLLRHWNEMRENWENTAFPSWKMCARKSGKRTIFGMEWLVIVCVNFEWNFPESWIFHSFSMCNVRKMRNISSIFRVVEFFWKCFILRFMTTNSNFTGQSMQPKMHRKKCFALCDTQKLIQMSLSLFSSVLKTLENCFKIFKQFLLSHWILEQKSFSSSLKYFDDKKLLCWEINEFYENAYRFEIITR